MARTEHTTEPVQEQPPALQGYLLRSAPPALLLGVAVLLLFLHIGHNTPIAVLAGLCTFIGIFLCALGWSYFRAMEQFYRHQPKQEEDTSAEADNL